MGVRMASAAVAVLSSSLLLHTEDRREVLLLL